MSYTYPQDRCDALRASNDSQFFTLTANGAVRCLARAPQLTRTAEIRSLVLFSMAAFSLIGNAATIASIRRRGLAKAATYSVSQHTYSHIYLLILHLSIADLLVTVFCLIGDAWWSYVVEWRAGNISCKLFKFSQVFSLYLSTFVLVLIGVDRFMVVRYPLRNIATPSRCNLMIGAAWFFSFLFSIPQLFVFQVRRGPFFEEFNQCVTYGNYTAAWQETLYLSFSLLTMFIIPLTILITTYMATVVALARSERHFRPGDGVSFTSDPNRRRILHRAKRKSLRLSVVIVAAFIVCWTPYYTMMLLFMLANPDQELMDSLQSKIFCFGMSNSLINPLIYGAFHLWRPRKNRQRGSMTSATSVRGPHKTFI